MEAGEYLNKPVMDQHGRGFSHNPLHDLESLWWVGVWSLLCHYSPNGVGDPMVQKHIMAIKTYGRTLFNKDSDSLCRRHALIGSDLVVDVMPIFFPQAVQHFIVALDVFRDQLVTYYKTYKPTASQDRLFFVPDVHRKFGDEFEDAMKDRKSVV